MNYSSVSSKIVIAKLDHDFNIPVSNWITSAPLWIADALDDLSMLMTFDDVQIELKVENNHTEIPDNILTDIQRIDAILYEGYLLSNTIYNKNKHIYNTTTITYHPSESYTIRNSYIVTTFEEGTIIVLCKVPKLEYDTEQMIYYPYIPDNKSLIIALEYYLMYCILRKGHKIMNMDLNSQNPLVNPYLMWQKQSDIAINNINALDPEERRELSRQYRTFIVNHQSNQNINVATANPVLNTQAVGFANNPYKFTI